MSQVLLSIIYKLSEEHTKSKTEKRARYYCKNITGNNVNEFELQILPRSTITKSKEKTVITSRKKPLSKYQPLLAFILPSPLLDREQYSPYQAINVVLNNSNKSKRAILDLPKQNNRYVVRKLTKNFVIELLITKKLIPVQHSTMYAMISSYLKDHTKVAKWWYAQNDPGPKHHMTPTTFENLKDSFTESTEGGCSMSKDELKKTLSEKLIEDRERTTGEKYKHDSVPESTLRRYVNEVISLYDFNVFNSVSNKTESRSVSEFSIRSTISFLLVVLTTHFIRGIATVFHKPKKEMEKSKLWKLVNSLNEKILGISQDVDIGMQLLHILPHLITSTDECSLFITTQVINKKIAWHFSARPPKGNVPTEDSSKRDNFSTHLSGDAHLRGVRISINNTFELMLNIQ